MPRPFCKTVDGTEQILHFWIVMLFDSMKPPHRARLNNPRRRARMSNRRASTAQVELMLGALPVLPLLLQVGALLLEVFFAHGLGGPGFSGKKYVRGVLFLERHYV